MKEKKIALLKAAIHCVENGVSFSMSMYNEYTLNDKEDMDKCCHIALGACADMSHPGVYVTGDNFSCDIKTIMEMK